MVDDMKTPFVIVMVIPSGGRMYEFVLVGMNKDRHDVGGEFLCKKDPKHILKFFNIDVGGF